MVDAFDALLKGHADAIAKGLADQIYQPTPLFFRVNQAARTPRFGPPVPQADHQAVTFTLYKGQAYIQGHGYESESGVVTREEAEDIIGWLTWALDNNLCPDDHEGDDTW
jgi:hypothetical protein